MKKMPLALASGAAAPGPRLDLGQKEFEALGGELVVDDLFTVAAGPQHSPRCLRARTDLVQGFAPFGLAPLIGVRPIV